MEISPEWITALVNFGKWTKGVLPPETYYEKGSMEVNSIKKSVIGRNLKKYFLDKNEKSKYCQDWKEIDNVAITFPGFQSFYAVNNFLRDFERFFVSLPDGIVSFVATVRGDVSIETISENGECFISASYKVTNVTSFTSFAYHIAPRDFPSGEAMENWTQYYQWEEKIKCRVKLPYDEMDDLMNKFPYNVNENMQLPSNPFFVPVL